MENGPSGADSADDLQVRNLGLAVSLLTAILFSCVFVLATAASSPAATSKCTAKKYVAYAKALGVRAKCYAKAIKKGDRLDDLCLVLAGTKLLEGWPKHEKHGDCVTTAAQDGDSLAIVNDTLPLFLDTDKVCTLGAGLPQFGLWKWPCFEFNGFAASKCDALKVKGIAKTAGKLAKEISKSIKKDVPFDLTTALLIHGSSVDAAIAKAEKKGDCILDFVEHTSTNDTDLRDHYQFGSHVTFDLLTSVQLCCDTGGGCVNVPELENGGSCSLTYLGSEVAGTVCDVSGSCVSRGSLTAECPSETSCP